MLLDANAMKGDWFGESTPSTGGPDLAGNGVGPARVEPEGQRRSPGVLGKLAGMSARDRKTHPIASGVLAYFPRALVALAHVSWVGNEQHNPGSALHWDRSKSGDELDALLRHVLQEIQGEDFDDDGVLHAAKGAWRALAHLEKKLEALDDSR